MGKIALDDFKVLTEPIEPAQVAFNGKPFVLRQHLMKKPCPSADPAETGVWARRDQAAVQDRLNDILQSRSLPDDLERPALGPNWSGIPESARF